MPWALDGIRFRFLFHSFSSALCIASDIGTGARSDQGIQFFRMSAKGGSSDDKAGGGNRVPVWNGAPETFFHFTQEVKWYLAGTKASERSYAAARLVRKLLESDYPALRSLMYRLDPSEFVDEKAIQKLITFLESSPMNRQPIPDAGAKLAAYYRKLVRKPNETIPQFLIREETLHDEMWRSLQRLLREKAIDFEKYDVTLAELKGFCGIDPEASVYYGGSVEEESARTQTPRGGSRADSEHGDSELGRASADSATGQPAQPLARKPMDLIQRLMDKGLVPLAALDIIRGWMLLEMTSESDSEKTLVKASTQNRLGYDSVRQALLVFAEDRGKGLTPPRGHRPGQTKGKQRYSVMYSVDEDSEWTGEDQEDWQADSWEGEQWAYWGPVEDHGGYSEEQYWSEPGIPTETSGQDSEVLDNGVEEAHQALLKLQEEERELQTYMADAQRNLEQARKAVAAAKKDRGWTSNRPPPTMNPSSKGTSTWMGKGKSKPSMFTQAKGFGGYGHFGKKGFGSFKGKGKQKAWLVEENPMQIMTMNFEGIDLNAETLYVRIFVSVLDLGARRCLSVCFQSPGHSSRYRSTLFHRLVFQCLWACVSFSSLGSL